MRQKLERVNILEHLQMARTHGMLLAEGFDAGRDLLTAFNARRAGRLHERDQVVEKLGHQPDMLIQCGRICWTAAGGFLPAVHVTRFVEDLHADLAELKARINLTDFLNDWLRLLQLNQAFSHQSGQHALLMAHLTPSGYKRNPLTRGHSAEQGLRFD